MTQKNAVALTVKERTESLNESLQAAFDAGLHVDVREDRTWFEGESRDNKRPLMCVEIVVRDENELSRVDSPKRLKETPYNCRHIWGKVQMISVPQKYADALATVGISFHEHEQCSKCQTTRYYAYPQSSGS